MEFLVEFESHIPSGTPEDGVQERYRAETDASARLAPEGRLLRLWRPPVEHGQRKALGLYRAESREELDAIIGGCRSTTGWTSP
jgi:muconolactone D-isomerase